VTGVSSTPRGNDQKIKEMLSDLKLRNRAQPFSYNSVTSSLYQLGSSSSGTSDFTQYVIYQTKEDTFLHSAEIHVRSVYTTTAQPTVTVDAYVCSNLTTSSDELTFNPFPDHDLVQVVPETKILAISAASSQGSTGLAGVFALGIQNSFISSGRFLVFRFVPPDWNGASTEGWNFATVTLHMAEFHQS
jgi:hypothetical protein